MEYRNLGKSGLVVSAIGLGTNNFGGRTGREQTEAVLCKALDCGITCIDTSDSYPPGEPSGRSEEFIGEILKAHRRDVILATKFGSPMGEGPLWRGASRRYLYNAVQDSLRRLQTDYIDLYQVHFPDSATPIDETLRALDDLVRAGMIRYTGCSNFRAWQIIEAHWAARTGGTTQFISAQNPYSLLDRAVEAEVIPTCMKYGLGVLPFYPLASGFLTGKYRRGEPAPEGTRLASGGRMAERTMTQENFATLQKLEEFAEARGHTVLELAIAWLAAQPAVGSVIAGATTPEQVEANVRAIEWSLTDAEVAEVSTIAQP
ncbi:MAG TPA: aldo/keto reductase [Dehalococcoidia bacterium]|nr:aldo/keto reductase [Dehalococcoidia bacterium]